MFRSALQFTCTRNKILRSFKRFKYLLLMFAQRTKRKKNFKRENKRNSVILPFVFEFPSMNTGADPGFDQGGAPDRDRPKTAILGPQFWCWGLIFGGQGGGRAPGPPWIRPWNITHIVWVIPSHLKRIFVRLGFGFEKK